MILLTAVSCIWVNILEMPFKTLHFNLGLETCLLDSVGGKSFMLDVCVSSDKYRHVERMSVLRTMATALWDAGKMAECMATRNWL